MTKIGILTFHKEINAGANLQAYALTCFLQNNGFDSEIIDFIPNSEVDRRSPLRKFLHLLKTRLNAKTRREENVKKEFEQFQKNNYLLSKDSYYGDADFVSMIPNKYDVLISGSDQILNLTLSGNSIAYYLPIKNVKKISYGSSFGRENISFLEKEAVKKYLCSFSHLSFREESAYQIVSSLIKVKEKNIVLDPVFLLTKHDWQKFVINAAQSKYVFVYCMETSEWLKKTIQHVHKLYPDYDVIVVFGSNSEFKLNFKHKKYLCVNPNDFISFLVNSEIVITNSFHGIAFSILFEKQFYCCAHSSRNTRLENLLTDAGESKNIISKETISFSVIDGQKCMKKLEKKLSMSKQYLLQSIK